MARSRRVMAFVLLFTALFMYNGKALAVEGVGAQSYITIEQQSGRVLYAKNADAQLPIASLTKVMTALVVLENAALSEMATVTPTSYGIEGSSIYLEKGEVLSVENLLLGLMLQSGNDAAATLAEHVAGSIAQFAQMMNAKAKELGMVNSHFVNPHGLPAKEHYSSAADMAIATRAAMQHEAFRRIVSTKRAQMPWANHAYERVITNKNRILTLYEGGNGVKTGYTKQAGRCLIAAAQRDGMQLISVVLNCPDMWQDSMALLDEGFGEFSLLQLSATGTPMVTVPSNGKPESALCIVNEDVYYPVGLAETITCQPHYFYDVLPAGVQKGDVIGYLSYMLDGIEVATADIVSAQTIQEKGIIDQLLRILGLYCFK